MDKEWSNAYKEFLKIGKFMMDRVSNIRKDTIKECIAIMEDAAKDHPLDGGYYEDADCHWPNRWEQVCEKIESLLDNKVVCQVCGNSLTRDQYEALRPVDASIGWCPSCGDDGDVRD